MNQAVKRGPQPMARGSCVADGCGSVADHPVSQLCAMHYKRRYRTGGTTRHYRDAGAGTITSNGYIAHGSGGKKKQEHVLIVEAVLGRPLPPGAEVHHVNENRADNRHSNLVVCPSRAYHKLLHQRQASLEACGNPDFRKCPLCKTYDDPANMKYNASRYFYHPECKSAYNRTRR